MWLFQNVLPPKSTKITSRELEGTVYDNGSTSSRDNFTGSLRTKLHTLRTSIYITHPQKTGIDQRLWRMVITDERHCLGSQ